MENNQPTLIYVSDPMCSWCYGFSGEFSKLRKLHPNTKIQLVMGGLRPYNTERIFDISEMLKHHWEQVAERSKQVFNHDILKDERFIYDTEPPARAVVVVRDLYPGLEVDFLKSVHQAFYKENRDTNDVQTYVEILNQLKVDSSDFAAHFNSEHYKQKVREDFQYASELGIRGFPSLVLHVNDSYFLVANGYSTAEEVSERINSVVKTNIKSSSSI